MGGPERPNILLVVLDTARADALGTDHDSAFAQLGRRGMSFTRAIAPAPWTLPSHASIFSGMRPSEHGITGEAVMDRDGPRTPAGLVASLSESWFPEILRRKGYQTFAASANPWVGPAVGLTLGFERVFESWRAAPLPKLADPLKVTASSGSGAARWRRGAAVYTRRALGLGDGGAAASLDAFGSFLDERDPRSPFLAFFNVLEPHAPYAPPRGFARGKRIRGLRTIRRWSAERMFRFCVGLEEIEEHDLSALRSLYGGEIAYCDSWLAKLLDVLEARALTDPTVVMVTSDHGENLGEHHLLSHVMSMHQTLLHVPLVVAGPHVRAGIETKPTSLMSLRDLATGLAEGRWEHPSTHTAISEYESAGAQVSGARRLGELVDGAPDEVVERVGAKWVATFEDEWKLVRSSPGEQALYNLDRDPLEMSDVSAHHPDVVSRLSAMARVPEARSVPRGDDLDPEITAHLEGLGYI